MYGYHPYIKLSDRVTGLSLILNYMRRFACCDYSSQELDLSAMMVVFFAAVCGQAPRLHHINVIENTTHNEVVKNLFGERLYWLYCKDDDSLSCR